MGTTGAICVGAALGLVGSLPPAALFELALRKTRPVSVAAGFAGIMASFTILVVALLAVWAVARTELAVLGAVFPGVSHVRVLQEEEHGKQKHQRGRDPDEQHRVS